MHKKSLFIIVCCCLLSILLSLKLGSVALSWPDVMQAFLSKQYSLASSIIWQIRLPRLLTAFCVGGLLALAGNLLQVLLQNPLAEPYILGISGGAACAYLIGILLGINVLLLPMLSFIGALTAAGLVLALCLRPNWNNQRLLLTGIITAGRLGSFE